MATTTTGAILSTIIQQHHPLHHDNTNTNYHQHQDEDEHSPTTIVLQHPTPATFPTQQHSPSSSPSAYSYPTFTTPITTLNTTTNVTLVTIAPPIIPVLVKWLYHPPVIRLYYYRHSQQPYSQLDYCNYYTSIQEGGMGMIYDMST
mmetsp:Transcript_26552/g.41656  ORF Transcript_26552/g.41656 Transcript_26552/m.41656 type:complete len:146 (+) Transcript_26552:243-680(+)